MYGLAFPAALLHERDDAGAEFVVVFVRVRQDDPELRVGGEGVDVVPAAAGAPARNPTSGENLFVPRDFTS